jgi:hypothetical protein
MKQTRSAAFLILLIVLCVALGWLFRKSFIPEQVLFANDGPLGVLVSEHYSAPEGFLGVWDDIHWLGMYAGTFLPNFTYTLLSLLGPFGFQKFYVPLATIILGLCAWVYFRRINCPPRMAVLAAVAAALNSNFLSNAAWGLGTRSLCLASVFLALAALEAGIAVQPILTSILAGLAIGLSIQEGGDNGAIFSLFVAAYAVWRTWIAYSARGKAAMLGVAKVVVMAVFAAVMAHQALNIFVRTAVKGVVGTAQDAQTKAEKWDFATQWSLPKIETLRVVIPGLFGYRMDTPEGGAYWGRVGEAPSAPQQMPRYSGAGEYAGVLVVLVGFWAIFEAMRAKGAFTPTERQLIGFWVVMGFIAMLLGWGRHAPFYQIVYALPYFSTIRNPMKFFHVVHLCLMVLFAYGLIGLNRRYLEGATKKHGVFGQLKSWWKSAPAHEKRWVCGTIAVVALGLVAWFGYVGSRGTVVAHLMRTGFEDRETAVAIAKFSANEVLLFVVFLAVSALLLTLVLSGAFAGARAKWALALLSLVLVVDLARANAPWIIHYNWKEKYASNPVIDVLKTQPHEHRVTMPGFQLNPQFGMLQQFYHVEWLQHHFPFYNIQSIDMPQEPRVPEDKQAYRNALGRNLARLWQLTNTRYVFGLAQQLPEMLNAQFDPQGRGFRVHTAFTLFQQPGSTAIGVETNTTGPFALLEFTGALPRAKLYNQWEVITNEQALLTRLADPAWNPAQSLLLSEPPPASLAPGAADAAGTAEITAYEPKEVTVRTTSAAPAMLLLNDKIEPEWNAYIDGQPAPILRANYLVRAVPVPAGTHNVTFRFEMRPTGLYIVLTCEVIGLILLGVVIWSARRRRPAAVTA